MSAPTSGRTGAASTAGNSRPNFARINAGPANSGTGAGSGRVGSNLSAVGSARAAQQFRCQQPAADVQRDDRRLPIDRLVQHGGGAHRRQQQYGRFRRQRGQLCKPARPGRFGRKQDQWRITGQQNGRSSAEVCRRTMHQTQAQHLRIVR